MSHTLINILLFELICAEGQVCHVCYLFLQTKRKDSLFDRAWNKQLVALHHVLQLAQIAHIVDFPAKLETAERQRDERISLLMF